MIYYEVYRDGFKLLEFYNQHKAELWMEYDAQYNPASYYEIIETNLPDIYQYYNPHPHGKDVNDCVKRALTKLLGDDYLEVQRELNKHKKVTGAKKFNDRNNWTSFVKSLGWFKHVPRVVTGYPRMRVWYFVRDNPTGSYLLKTRKHTVAVVDGIIFDSWDSRNEVIYHYWEVR